MKEPDCCQLILFLISDTSPKVYVVAGFSKFTPGRNKTVKVVYIEEKPSTSKQSQTNFKNISAKELLKTTLKFISKNHRRVTNKFFKPTKLQLFTILGNISMCANLPRAKTPRGNLQNMKEPYCVKYRLPCNNVYESSAESCQ